MTEHIVRRALRLEVYRGGHCVMNVSSPHDDEVLMLRDKMIATNSDTIEVRLYEEVWTDRLLSNDEFGSVPQHYDDSEYYEDIGL